VCRRPLRPAELQPTFLRRAKKTKPGKILAAALQLKYVTFLRHCDIYNMLIYTVISKYLVFICLTCLKSVFRAHFQSIWTGCSRLSYTGEYPPVVRHPRRCPADYQRTNDISLCLWWSAGGCPPDPQWISARISASVNEPSDRPFPNFFKSNSIAHQFSESWLDDLAAFSLWVV
jgi:hypothetical protein